MLFREAAVYNESRGFNGIGYMYMNGLYVEKDVEKAVYYFKSNLF
jgi:TPR repeat protein